MCVCVCVCLFVCLFVELFSCCSYQLLSYDGKTEAAQFCFDKFKVILFCELFLFFQILVILESLLLLLPSFTPSRLLFSPLLPSFCPVFSLKILCTFLRQILSAQTFLPPFANVLDWPLLFHLEQQLETPDYRMYSHLINAYANSTDGGFLLITSAFPKPRVRSCIQSIVVSVSVCKCLCTYSNLSFSLYNFQQNMHRVVQLYELMKRGGLK